MAAMAAYNEFVELIARMNPARVLDFKITEATLQRVQELVMLQSAGTLSPEEQTELHYFVYLENIIGLAKARAAQLAQAA
jgi:hypothetical protein